MTYATFGSIVAGPCWARHLAGTSGNQCCAQALVVKGTPLIDNTRVSITLFESFSLPDCLKAEYMLTDGSHLCRPACPGTWFPRAVNPKKILLMDGVPVGFNNQVSVPMQKL